MRWSTAASDHCLIHAIAFSDVRLDMYERRCTGETRELTEATTLAEDISLSMNAGPPLSPRHRIASSTTVAVVMILFGSWGSSPGNAVIGELPTR
ncbi:hypothetical protein XI04_03365 [Bradyrhizobium sp. CCBAU 11430]|nr:hypothetical protein [Bradyrhizobium sp. CCBAU 11430]